jgi:PH domain
MNESLTASVCTCGKIAAQDARIRETVMAPSQDTLAENKLLTICYSTTDMVNTMFLNFVALGRDVEKVC